MGDSRSNIQFISSQVQGMDSIAEALDAVRAAHARADPEMQFPSSQVQDMDAWRICIAFPLMCSMVFAATIKKDCKPNCIKDCMEVGNGDKEGTHCTMVFGNGPDGVGWYGSDDNGSDQLGSPMPVSMRENVQHNLHA